MRHKDFNWDLKQTPCSTADAQLAVLMDIRDELKQMNSTLSVLTCSNFIAIPRLLRRISSNTAKPRKKKTARKVLHSS